jgi:hypothetical protein
MGKQRRKNKKRLAGILSSHQQMTEFEKSISITFFRQSFLLFLRFFITLFFHRHLHCSTNDSNYIRRQRIRTNEQTNEGLLVPPLSTLLIFYSTRNNFFFSALDLGYDDDDDDNKDDDGDDDSPTALYHKIRLF